MYYLNASYQEDFTDVLRNFCGCFKDVSRVIQESCRVVSRVFQGYSQKVKWFLKDFQRCFKKVSRVFQESFRMLQWSFKCVSRKIEGCSNGVWSLFQGRLKEAQCGFEGNSQSVSGLFQGSFKGFSKKIDGCFEIPLWVDLRELQGSPKEVKRVFHGILRKCQVCFKKISLTSWGWAVPSSAQLKLATN